MYNHMSVSYTHLDVYKRQALMRLLLTPVSCIGCHSLDWGTLSYTLSRSISNRCISSPAANIFSVTYLIQNKWCPYTNAPVWNPHCSSVSLFQYSCFIKSLGTLPYSLQMSPSLEYLYNFAMSAHLLFCKYVYTLLVVALLFATLFSNYSFHVSFLS